MSLNTHSPIPLYRQLADRIRAEIDAGRYAVAARIPSEHALARCYAIGRPTVRQATDLLVRQGRLERRRGSGTFVRRPRQSIDLFSLAGTSAALHKSELNARLEIVKPPVRDVISAESAMESTADTDAVADAIECIRLERRATVDGLPVLYETLWFDAELFPGLENHTLENVSLAELVRDVYFLEPTSAEQTFLVIMADDSLAEKLAVAVASPLLRVQRNLHFAEHRSALRADIHCRTDRFEFSQTLYPAQRNEDPDLSISGL